MKENHDIHIEEAKIRRAEQEEKKRDQLSTNLAKWDNFRKQKEQEISDKIKSENRARTCRTYWILYSLFRVIERSKLIFEEGVEW